MCSVIILTRFDSNWVQGNFLTIDLTLQSDCIIHLGLVPVLYERCYFTVWLWEALAEPTSFCARQCSLLMPWYRTVTFLVPNLVLWNFWSSRRKRDNLSRHSNKLDHILKFEIWNLSRVFCYQVETKTSSRQITTTQRKFCCLENRKSSGETNNFGPIKGWKKIGEQFVLERKKKLVCLFSQLDQV